MKVVFACPTVVRPHAAFLKAVEDSVPLLDSAGLEHQIVFEVDCPYISAARATMIRKALDAQADVIVCLDHDLSWSPPNLLKLITTPGDVVAGTYRFKKDEEEYMGSPEPLGDAVAGRADGCLSMLSIPAGFLKLTKQAIHKFMGAYPELMYGERFAPHVDLFNHGAHKGVWYGEDYAFSRNWKDMGEDIWVVPDLDITHHSKDTAYPGNYFKFLSKGSR